MVQDVRVVGMRGDASFDDMVQHFLSLGGESVIMDPMQVYGREMALSAVLHAERAFAQGTNSSKSILTEIILYASGERQISKALSKMRPKDGVKEYVAVILGIDGDLHLDEIGMIQDDSVIEGSPLKAKAMGLENDLNVPYDALALERVTMVDILKKTK